MSSEWNADAYDRVSDPQYRWGLRVLDRLRLTGDERVLDAGCGSGRLTAVLLGRLPGGTVVALDRAREMLQCARRSLVPATGQRLAFVLADLARLPMRDGLDAVFSTATFHWVLDHGTLFEGLRHALRPGGRLVAQCGGAGNLDRLHAHAHDVMHSPRWSGHFDGWTRPWEFASADTARARLEAAGFVGVRTWLENEPTHFPDEASFVEFVSTVVLRLHLDRIPPAERGDFIADVAARSRADVPPLTLDYVRLNIEACVPGRRA